MLAADNDDAIFESDELLDLFSFSLFVYLPLHILEMLITCEFQRHEMQAVLLLHDDAPA